MTLLKRGPQDAAKINIHEQREVDHWCKALGVTIAQLKDAVIKAGTSVSAVRTYLGK